MLDGVYQSVMVFFVPYLLFMSGTSVTFSGLGIDDRIRFGAYIAHPAVLTINAYILINTYRWDWLMLLIVVISDLLIFFWTGVYSSFASSQFFYKAAFQVYQEATFWAVFFIVPVVCLFPRYGIKAMQKVYFPYDVDIIREQEQMGMFDHLTQSTAGDDIDHDRKSQKSKSSDSSRKIKHQHFASVDEDLRPIYPPSTATRTTNANQHSQNGSDSTNYTSNRFSVDGPLSSAAPVRPNFERMRTSIDRPRPSYDRVRASMDRVRLSFEASHDFTSAARLSRIESSQSQAQPSRFRTRLRGLSLSKSAEP